MPAALLEHAESDQAREAAGEHHPHPSGPAQASPLEQRVGDGQDRAGQEQRADEVRSAGLPVMGFGDRAQRGDERYERDRDVDEEHRAPGPAEEIRVGERSAEDQPERRGEATGRPIHTEGLSALLTGEDRPKGGEHLRDHRAAAAPWTTRAAISSPGFWATPLARLAAPKRDPSEEDALSAEQVAEAAGDDQRRREGEHVRRDHPFELGAARAQVAADGRQRDVHHGDVASSRRRSSRRPQATGEGRRVRRLSRGWRSRGGRCFHFDSLSVVAGSCGTTLVLTNEPSMRAAGLRPRGWIAPAAT
ncbi:MAG TPA: hypothetical protein VHF45_12805 [Thermoleophilaceae bacterium]|nr:hypothetical protein [Thermoleophilaceae bacterium]